MSQDEIREDIRKLTESGRISHAVARVANEQPVEGEKILRLDRIEKETKKQSLAIFGDDELEIPGLVKDVKGIKADIHGLKTVIYRGVWTMSGIVATCTTILALLELYVSWIHK